MKPLNLTDIPEQTQVRFKLMAVSQKKTMRDLFVEMVNYWWEKYSDLIPVNGKVKKVVKRILRRRRTPV